MHDLEELLLKYEVVRVREEILLASWKAFKPSIIPRADKNNIGGEIPVVSEIYAHCPYTRTPMHAFGTLIAVRGRWEIGVRLRIVWFRDRQEAEAAQARSQAIWDADRPRRQFSAACSHLDEILRYRSDDLSGELRLRAETLLGKNSNIKNVVTQELADASWSAVREIWNATGYTPPASEG